MLNSDGIKFASFHAGNAFASLCVCVCLYILYEFALKQLNGDMKLASQPAIEPTIRAESSQSTSQLIVRSLTWLNTQHTAQFQNENQHTRPTTVYVVNLYVFITVRMKPVYAKIRKTYQHWQQQQQQQMDTSNAKLFSTVIYNIYDTMYIHTNTRGTVNGNCHQFLLVLFLE